MTSGVAPEICDRFPCLALEAALFTGSDFSSIFLYRYPDLIRRTFNSAVFSLCHCISTLKSMIRPLYCTSIGVASGSLIDGVDHKQLTGAIG